MVRDRSSERVRGGDASVASGTPNHQLQGPLHDEKEHVAWSTSLTWEEAFPINLNPCLEFAIQQQERMGQKVVEWRETVVADVQSLVNELSDEQDEWLSQAPEHVQQVYKQGTPRFVVQLPQSPGVCRTGIPCSTRRQSEARGRLATFRA